MYTSVYIDIQYEPVWLVPGDVSLISLSTSGRTVNYNFGRGLRVCRGRGSMQGGREAQPKGRRGKTFQTLKPRVAPKRNNKEDFSRVPRSLFNYVHRIPGS